MKVNPRAIRVPQLMWPIDIEGERERAAILTQDQQEYLRLRCTAFCSRVWLADLFSQSEYESSISPGIPRS